MKVLVTGGQGAIGTALVPRLDELGHIVTIADTDYDVTDWMAVHTLLEQVRPDLIYHLAGAKSAPDGETDPGQALEVNAVGTANVVDVAELVGARVVTASSCKACNPETAYGASKLLAEKLTIQAGGSVARFYNVRETAGNVFDFWAGLPAGEPLPVTPCWRYVISLDQALELLLATAELPAGRYTVDPGPSRPMFEWAELAHPGRAQRSVRPRRGDRLIEPRHAANERLIPLGAGLERIEATHDAALAIPVVDAPILERPAAGAPEAVEIVGLEPEDDA